MKALTSNGGGAHSSVSAATMLLPRRRSGALGDAAMLAIAIVVSELGAERAGLSRTPWLMVVAYPLLVLAILGSRRAYERRRRTSLLDELRSVATTTALAAMIIVAVRVFFTSDPAIAQQGARLWAFSVFYVGGWRALTYYGEQSARARGERLQPTLIVGAGVIGQLLARRLLERPQFGLRPIGFLDKEPLSPEPLGLPVLGASWDLERVVQEHGVEHVVVCFSTAPIDVLLRLLERVERLGIYSSFVPRLYERTTTRLTIEHIGGLPLVAAHQPDLRGWQFALKHVSDRVVAALLLTLVAPVFVTAAAAVALSLGRPIFFRQPRVGRDGVEFDMLKFRTMKGAPEDRGEADAAWARQQLDGSARDTVAVPARADHRTPVGRLLRQTSLDELPQLLNVVCGHMSLVGPRPERVQYVRAFEAAIYRYDQRHRVKSGITGWAQVNGLRGKTSVADRAEWDNYYIENFSLWLDFKILLLTLAAVVRGAKTVE